MMSRAELIRILKNKSEVKEFLQVFKLKIKQIKTVNFNYKT